MRNWWLPLDHRRAWMLLSLALVALVIFASLAPEGVQAVSGIGDKWQHATTYFVLAAWFSGLVHRRSYVWVAVALLALGASLEVLQHLLTTHRVADPRDMAANTAGVLTGIIAGYAGLGAWAQRVEAWLRKPR